MSDLQGVILFCDDVRDEASGKTTLVGVYGATFVVGEDSPGLAEIVGSFNGRVRGGKSVHLRITVEVLNHSIQLPPHVVEEEFVDQSGVSYEEWTLRINTRIQVPFEEGAILKMTVESRDFKADATLLFALQPGAKRMERAEDADS